MESAATHEFVFSKMHHDRQIHACKRCGCLKIVKPDGSIWFRRRGGVHWNPFDRLERELPACVPVTPVADRAPAEHAHA